MKMTRWKKRVTAAVLSLCLVAVMAVPALAAAAPAEIPMMSGEASWLPSSVWKVVPAAPNATSRSTPQTIYILSAPAIPTSTMCATTRGTTSSIHASSSLNKGARIASLR